VRDLAQEEGVLRLHGIGREGDLPRVFSEERLEPDAPEQIASAVVGVVAVLDVEGSP
jgi:hypothetical protein